jgi:peptidoglycan/xylan/chitin deacetylase (PgdA/CDA1 family)/GT2 family glycosyltransferase
VFAAVTHWTADPFAYSVVIPTKDRSEVVIGAAAHLADQELAPVAIVIVDASSPPLEVPADLRDRLASKGIALVVAHDLPSTAAQRNHGADLVETPLLLFMDDDMQLPPNYVSGLVARWKAHGFDKLTGAVGGMDGVFVTPRRFDRLFRELFQLHLYDPEAASTSFRRSQKLRFTRPEGEVFIPAASTAAVLYRTALVQKHRFSERFDGYVLGEDIDFSTRLTREGPILHVPDVRCVHTSGPAQPQSSQRWHHRGRHEAYFRLRRLEPGMAATAAFTASVIGELVGATIDSVREREPHALHFLRGLRAAVADARADQRGHLALKPRPYYALNHAYRRGRVARRKRGGVTPWNGVRILGYHRIASAPDVLAVEPSKFRRQLEWALAQNIRPIRVDAALDLLAKPVEERCFCITFDDGYRDNLEIALPILEDLGLPATIYVPTAVVDRTAVYEWYRKPPPALSWDDLASIVSGGLVDVQAHTRTHRALPRLTADEAREEIAGAKTDLEHNLGVRVTTMAYPAGIYTERDVVLVREAGYRGALTTTSGVNRGAEPLETLKRTMLMAGDTLDDFAAKMNGLLDQSSMLEQVVRSRRARTIA